eukprot:GHVU01146163.1.p1 GENE.GHVU01146163.1~~GHVU01146163.1.p1  ORF type:complete len:167 (-),score=19.97 GHVU01146163.1:925-1425(-)
MTTLAAAQCFSCWSPDEALEISKDSLSSLTPDSVVPRTSPFERFFFSQVLFPISDAGKLQVNVGRNRHRINCHSENLFKRKLAVYRTTRQTPAERQRAAEALQLQADNIHAGKRALIAKRAMPVDSLAGLAIEQAVQHYMGEIESAGQTIDDEMRTHDGQKVVSVR